jgi:hypothetical protein
MFPRGKFPEFFPVVLEAKLPSGTPSASLQWRRSTLRSTPSTLEAASVILRIRRISRIDQNPGPESRKYAQSCRGPAAPKPRESDSGTGAPSVASGAARRGQALFKQPIYVHRRRNRDLGRCRPAGERHPRGLPLRRRHERTPTLIRPPSALLVADNGWCTEPNRAAPYGPPCRPRRSMRGAWRAFTNSKRKSASLTRSRMLLFVLQRTKELRRMMKSVNRLYRDRGR